MANHVHDRAKLFAADEAGRRVVNDWMRVVGANDAAGGFLNFQRGCPRAVDVLVC